MSEYDAGKYGRSVGDSYDSLYPGTAADTEAAVSLLVRLAKEGVEPSLLEFGIGTGRLAIGVQDQGVQVAGIDGAEHMIAQLRSKPGGDKPDVRIGDYRTTKLERIFDVVILVFNGIFDPRGRAAQLDIFRNAAAHLRPGGYFVVESWVMNDQQRSGDWSVVPRYVGESHVEFQLARYDIDTNQIERTLVHLRPGGSDFVAVKDTYASPNELDLMAEVTGFERAARYSRWSLEPYTISSVKYIGVYRKVADHA